MRVFASSKWSVWLAAIVLAFVMVARARAVDDDMGGPAPSSDAPAAGDNDPGDNATSGMANPGADDPTDGMPPGGDDSGPSDPGSVPPGWGNSGPTDPGSVPPGWGNSGPTDPGSMPPGWDNSGPSDPGSMPPGWDNSGPSDPGSMPPGWGNSGPSDPGSMPPGWGNSGPSDPGSMPPDWGNSGPSDPGSMPPGWGNSGPSDPGSMPPGWDNSGPTDPGSMPPGGDDSGPSDPGSMPPGGDDSGPSDPGSMPPGWGVSPNTVPGMPGNGGPSDSAPTPNAIPNAPSDPQPGSGPDNTDAQQLWNQYQGVAQAAGRRSERAGRIASSAEGQIFRPDGTIDRNAYNTMINNLKREHRASQNQSEGENEARNGPGGYQERLDQAATLVATGRKAASIAAVPLGPAGAMAVNTTYGALSRYTDATAQNQPFGGRELVNGMVGDGSRSIGGRLVDSALGNGASGLIGSAYSAASTGRDNYQRTHSIGDAIKSGATDLGMNLVETVAVNGAQRNGMLGGGGAPGPKTPPNPGGRLGKESTRAQIKNIADEMEQRGYTITGGGGRLPEEYLPGPGGGRRGSSNPDITATINGRTVRVNTIDTRADGITPTTREANNAARIRGQTPGDHLLLIPKPR